MKLVRYAAVAGGLTLTAATGLLTAVPQPASAAPNFQMPFTCGYTAVASTWSGHSPTYAIDWQKSGITGDRVLASAPGTVSRVEQTAPGESYGKWIEISHAGGWTTRYAHLSKQSVHVGQKVKLGTKIGNAGQTGGARGPHVHYEQRHGGQARKAVINGRKVPYFQHTTFTSKNKCGGGGGNPYTPKEVCGSAYKVIDHHALGKSGTAYLAYNSANGKNCVVALKSTKLGKKTKASAFLTVKGHKKAKDSGKFGYYAGPVRKKAVHTCVKWGGSVGSATYASGWEHCK